MTHPVRYSIIPRDPAAHLFEITLTIEAPDPAGQRLVLPAWIPGSYMIREFARNIVRISATAGGAALPLCKRDKHSWQTAPCTEPIRLTYEVYAWDLSVRIAWTVRTADQDNLFGVQLRNGVLIYTPDLPVEPADLTVTTSKDGLAKLVLGSASPDELQRTGDLTVEDGDLATLADLFELVDQFPFWFNIVTP